MTVAALGRVAGPALDRIAGPLLVVHAAATWAMAGIIWFVQVVHYPLFARVGRTSFPAYEADHLRITPWVVGPPMIAEAVTALLLLWRRPAGVGVAPAWMGVALLAAIWLCTDFMVMPLHHTLVDEFRAPAHALLVRSNWVRTVAWSARAALAAWMLAAAMRAARPDGGE